MIEFLIGVIIGCCIGYIVCGFVSFNERSDSK